jgi:hypothetical protein
MTFNCRALMLGPDERKRLNHGFETLGSHLARHPSRPYLLCRCSEQLRWRMARINRNLRNDENQMRRKSDKEKFALIRVIRGQLSFSLLPA